MEHVWLAPGEAPNTSQWTCCRLCGTVQRADGKPQSACRGRVRVALRDTTDPDPAITEMAKMGGAYDGAYIHLGAVTVGCCSRPGHPMEHRTTMGHAFIGSGRGAVIVSGPP